ncbi:MAG: hypothetical protein JW874_15955 [Spirochaetales bacterium]|nr:hypothetical protein [Spirochaetales bacterium]
MAKKTATWTPQNLIKFSLGIFFLILGILGIVPSLEEGGFSLNNKMLSLEVIFGVVELICGLFIIVSMFMVFTRKLKYRVAWIILVFWLARIFLSKIVWGFRVVSKGIMIYPNLSTWLLVLSCELVIAACLWMNVRTYKD